MRAFENCPVPRAKTDRAADVGALDVDAELAPDPFRYLSMDEDVAREPPQSPVVADASATLIVRLAEIL